MRAGWESLRVWLRVSCLLAVVASVAHAQLSEGYQTNFEDAPGWTFQHLDENTRWKIDATPQIFVSQDKTLNNLDQVSQLTALAPGGYEAEAYSPSGFFAGPGGRRFEHWCRYQMGPNVDEGDATGHHLIKREMKVGTNLLLTNPIVTFVYDADVTPAANLFGTATGDIVNSKFVIPCPTSAWHKHVFVISPAGGPILHTTSGENPLPTEAIVGSGPAALALSLAVVLQCAYLFAWRVSDHGIGGIHYSTVAWFIDDLRIQLPSEPFRPTFPPTGVGTKTGGHSEGCFSNVANLPSGSLPPPGSRFKPGGDLIALSLILIGLGVIGQTIVRRLRASIR